MGSVAQVTRAENPARETRVGPESNVRTEKAIQWVVRNSIRLEIASPLDWAVNNLYRWLKRMALGKTKDDRTPFFRTTRGGVRVDTPRSTIVKRWWAKLTEAFSKAPLVESQIKYLVLHEEAQAANISAQSTFLPWDQDGPDKMNEYWFKKTFKPSNSRAWDKAVEWFIAQVPHNSLSAISIDDVLFHENDNPYSMDDVGMDATTNSCNRHFQRQWIPNESQPAEARSRSTITFNAIREEAHWMMDQFRAGKTVTVPCIASQRLTQKADQMKKKRLVIGCGKAIVVVQKTITTAIQKAFQSICFDGGVPLGVALTDLPNIDLAMQQMLQTAEDEKRSVLCVDYSGFDKGQYPWLMQEGVRVFAEWVKDSEWMLPLERSLNEHAYVITPTAIYEPAPCAQLSGNNWTLILNGMVSALIIRYGHECGYYALRNASVQGDDGVIDAEGITGDIYAKVASEFGLKVNADKEGQVPRALSYLQRVHLLGKLGGITLTMRTLGSLLSYERMRYSDWNAESDIIRAYAQLENDAFHPCFESFVNFMASGDKYGLYANLSTDALLNKSGSSGKDFLLRYSAQVNRANVDEKDPFKSFNGLAVRGVLRGESLPPLGSYARFLRVYGQDRIDKVIPVLRQQLDFWRSRGDSL